MKRNKASQKIALSGLTAALCAVMMLVAGYLNIGIYTAPMAAGLLIYLLSCLVGTHYGWSCFAVVTVISFLLSPNKEAVILFGLFLGYYPLVKSTLEKIRFKVFQYLLKLVILNAVSAIIYWILTAVFSVSADTFAVFGVHILAVFIVAVNVAFVVYDYAITLFNRKYIFSFLEKVTKLFQL